MRYRLKRQQKLLSKKEVFKEKPPKLGHISAQKLAQMVSLGIKDIGQTKEVLRIFAVHCGLTEAFLYLERTEIEKIIKKEEGKKVKLPISEIRKVLNSIFKKLEEDDFKNSLLFYALTLTKDDPNWPGNTFLLA